VSGIGEGDEQSEEMQIARWLADRDSSADILAKPLWVSPADDGMLPPEPQP